MVEEEMLVGIVVERRKLSSPWLDHAWLPVAVLPGAPDVAAWTLLDPNEGSPRYYAGAHPIRLFPGETAQHRDNLASGQPRIWVAVRPTGAALPADPPVAIVGVTVDPSEGEAFTYAGDDVVEALPMPPEIAGRVAGFVEAHHIERPFVKRKRDRADPEGLGQRPPAVARKGAGDDE
jgi:hypothetical protein